MSIDALRSLKLFLIVSGIAQQWISKTRHTQGRIIRDGHGRN